MYNIFDVAYILVILLVKWLFSIYHIFDLNAFNIKVIKNYTNKLYLCSQMHLKNLGYV